MVPIRILLDLFTYAACIFGVLPLYAFLELPGKILFPAALLTGFICDRRQRYFLGPLPATLLSILPFAYYGLRLSMANVVAPVVNLLVLLLGIRLVTEKQPRHYLQIFVLAIFSLAGSSLLTLSPLFLPVLVLQVASVTLGLVLLTFHASDQQMCLPAASLRPLFAVSLVLPIGSLLLMLVFFAVLPRTQYPMWNFLNSDRTAVSGFSENVRPGAFARNAESSALVFRVESEPLGAEDLYWRGIVLNVAEGSDWRRETPPTGERLRLAGGRQVSQVVYPEAREDTYLFALDPTERIDGLRAGSSVDLVHRRRGSSKKPVSYRTVARVGADLAAKGLNRDFYLQTPGNVSLRLREKAAELAAGTDNAAVRIARTEDFFRGQKLIYATIDLPGAERPMEEFLFDKKRGYCEFFAGSFALLLRLEGVPARLVGGYHGGSRNDLVGYYTITEDMAHVWVEALVDGAWRRIDPSRLAVNAGSAPFAGSGRSLAWHRRLIDAADYYWTRAVISYDLNTQVELVQGTLFKIRGISFGPRFFLVVGWSIAGIGGLFAAAWLLRLLAVPAELRLMKQFLHLLERRFKFEGIRDAAGLHTLAEQTGDARCREFAALLGGAVYRDRRLGSAEQSRLRRLLKEMRRG